MEKIEENHEIALLFLQKLEKLTDEERCVLIKTIDLINHPMFIASNAL